MFFLSWRWTSWCKISTVGAESSGIGIQSKRKMKCLCTSTFTCQTLTWGQLHPCTDPVDVPGVAEEEQTETDHGANNQQHGRADEEHGSPEGRGRDGGKVQYAALTDELRGQRVPDAVVGEAEVTSLRGVDAVPDPVGLDEDHHGDDGEADGENGPHHADCPRVSHIVGVVDFGCLLGWKQIHVKVVSDFFSFQKTALTFL